MTTSVRGLLDAIHAQAWELAGAGVPPAGEARQAWAAGLLAGWPRLATVTVRALDAVPVGASRREDVAAVRDSLLAVARGKGVWPDPARSEGRWVPNREVLGMAARMGAIADLLGRQPEATSDSDVAAGLGLQANLLAPVFAVATSTVAALDGLPGVVEPRWALRRVVARTEPYALVQGADRSGRYDDVAVAEPCEVSLDGAIGRWGPATVQALGSRYGVTGVGLQAAAGDVLIVTAAAATVCAAAVRLGVVDARRGERALTGLAATHAAWREPTRWPPTVRLDGVRSPEQTGASQELRQVITESLRRDRQWLGAEQLAGLFDLPGLLATMRRGMHAAGNVALAHYQAVENLVRGRDQLWIAATAVTEPAFQTPAVVEAACRRRWIPMPRGLTTGDQLLAAARQAMTATTVALAALDRTGAASSTVPDGSRSSLSLERGRIVARLRGAPPPVGESPGVRAERMIPIAMTERTSLGPRR